MNTRKEWGKVIQEARLKQKMTQIELARLMDVSPRSVQAWEQGVRNITPSDLVALVRLLSIPPSELFEEEVGVA